MQKNILLCMSYQDFLVLSFLIQQGIRAEECDLIHNEHEGRMLCR